MRPYAIIADATCDLKAEFRERYDIRIVPGHIKLPDGTEREAPLEWTEFGRDEFYADLKRDPAGYTTSPANVEGFRAAMEQAVKEGLDALVMTISSGISGAFGFAQQARAAVLDQFPEARIVCVDSMRYGPGFGLMVVHASMLRAEGRSLEETAAWLEENKSRFRQAGWLDDLSFVAKKGRITHPKAFFGTLAGVKPIGECDVNGLTTVVGKVKGTKTAYAALMHYIEETIEEPEDQIVFIAQTNRLPQAEEYKRLIEERFHPKAVYINDVFPSCGINIGPGLMAAYYVGKPISDGLVVEKKLIEDFISGGAAK